MQSREASLPCHDALALRKAGRTPPVPFELALADGSIVVVNRLLRVLPGKRIVGVGQWQAHAVLVKLFVATSSQRHWARELAGISALRDAGLPTPALRHAGSLPGGGHVVLTEFLSEAESLADRWGRAVELAGHEAAIDVLQPAMRLLADMHRHGLMQTDLHLDNFLVEGGACWVIDGDAINTRFSPGPLAAKVASENLAVLFAQLPVAWEHCLPAFLATYVQAGGQWLPEVLYPAIARIRAWRLRDYLKKTVRNCSLFSVQHSFRRFSSVPRQELPRLAVFLRDPDALLASGSQYKGGGASTVARAELNGLRLVVKRYNLKDWRHLLSRFWRPSRGWRSWHEAHRLLFHGLATPRPLALVEERWGILRGRAFFVSEFCPGPSLLELLDCQHEPEPELKAALLLTFQRLHSLRISHGDLKATNLFWHEGQVVLIDLDAMTQHRTVCTFQRAWASDRRRLLRNWPADSVLVRWLDASLPQA